MSDVDSTEVVYTIRQWSLPGAAVMPVLNVSSRMPWLELDDQALLDSYTVLQEGILCDVFSQKCSAAWQGAPGQRFTVAIMLPGRQLADDWLDFMLSQKNPWPPLLPGGLSDPSWRTTQTAGQASMEGGQAELECVGWPDVHSGPDWEVMWTTLCAAVQQGSQGQPKESKKAYRGPANNAVQAWWEQCQEWMMYYKCQCEPLVQDCKGFLHAFRGKEEDARAEAEA